MKHRSVVANFIFRCSDTGKTEQQVALFLRSHHPNIRSYQGKYAPISGSIELVDASPELAAEREILEETQLLAGSDLTIEFRGQPYSFEDEQAGRSWTVHPFGWNLETDDSKITIDWEHDSWAWFDPQDILDGSMSEQCVPKLDKSLQRVYFGPNGIFRGGGYLVGRGNTPGMRFLQTIDRLKNDLDNGARVLALEAIKGLHDISQCFKGSPIEGQKSSEYWHALRTAAYHFIYSSRPSMNAAIRTTVLEALEEVANSTPDSDLDPIVACRIFDTRMNQQRSSSGTAQAFKAYIDQIVQQDTSPGAATTDQTQATKSGRTINILTLSQSSTILAVLKHLLTSTDNVIGALNLTILESRPRCEGATLAASIVESIASTSNQLANLSIKIVPDSHANHILSTPPQPQSTTLILLGADRITPFSNVTNKTGSRALATLSKTLQPGSTKTIVLSETAKISSADPSHLELLKSLITHAERNTPLSTENQIRLSNLTNQDLESRAFEPHAAEEVYAAWSENTRKTLLPYFNRNTKTDTIPNISVGTENLYFENIPSSEIDVFIAETGELSRADIMQISVERRELEDRVFKDLYPE